MVLLILVVGIPSAWADSQDAERDYVPLIRSGRYWEYWADGSLHNRMDPKTYYGYVVSLCTFENIYTENDTTYGKFVEIETQGILWDFLGGEQYE